MSGLVSLRIAPVAASIRIAERSAGSGAASRSRTLLAVALGPVARRPDKREFFRRKLPCGVVFDRAALKAGGL